ncbi:hypothetical protein GGR57DRAFT_503306 [Xylariaceae sp. FL1272]|nr:hypothetical protein GGR57DRAFT_503306 [Xylariaceae sp. FL1272]
MRDARLQIALVTPKNAIESQQAIVEGMPPQSDRDRPSRDGGDRRSPSPPLSEVDLEDYLPRSDSPHAQSTFPMSRGAARASTSYTLEFEQPNRSVGKSNHANSPDQLSRGTIAVIKVFRCLQANTCLAIIVLGAEAFTSWIRPSETSTELFQWYIYVGVVSLITLGYFILAWFLTERFFKNLWFVLADMTVTLLWLVAFGEFASLLGRFESEEKPYDEVCYQKFHIVITGLLAAAVLLASGIVVMHIYHVIHYRLRWQHDKPCRGTWNFDNCIWRMFSSVSDRSRRKKGASVV